MKKEEEEKEQMEVRLQMMEERNKKIEVKIMKNLKAKQAKTVEFSRCSSLKNTGGLNGIMNREKSYL